MAKVNTADVGFEKQIWNAADVLRGSMDAAEYKHVVLGLIFLKYISDRFEAKYQELVNEGYGMEEDKDEYNRKRTACCVFRSFRRGKRHTNATTFEA